MAFMFRWLKSFFYKEEVDVNDENCLTSDPDTDTYFSYKPNNDGYYLNYGLHPPGTKTYFSKRTLQSMTDEEFVATYLRSVYNRSYLNAGLSPAYRSQGRNTVKYDNKWDAPRSLNNIVQEPAVEVNLLPVSEDRSLNGRIASKTEQEIVIRPINICCNIENVKSDFVPIEGDWVSVTAEVSEDFEEYKLRGETIKIKTLKPLSVINGTGRIIELMKIEGYYVGIIENEIYFCQYHCQIDGNLTIGAQVTYVAIESDQGVYAWRATSVNLSENSQEEEDWNSENSIRTNDSDKRQTEELGKSKKSIEFEGNFNLGPLEMGQSEKFTITVTNTGRRRNVLKRVRCNLSKKRSQLNVISPEREVDLKPGDSVKTVIEFTGKFLGPSREEVVFEFSYVKITKHFNLKVSHKEEAEDLTSPEESGNERVPRRNTFYSTTFDVSQALFGKKSNGDSRFSKNSRRRPVYIIPENLFKVVLREVGCPTDGKSRDSRLKKFAPILDDVLNVDNYKEKLHKLLYLEEIHKKIQLRAFDIENVKLEKTDKHLLLDVKHLQNSELFCPMYLNVMVTSPWTKGEVVKQVGVVDAVIDGILHIFFHVSFHSNYKGEECKIIFQPLRTPYIRCHTAVDLAFERLGRGLLFPESIIEKPPHINARSTEMLSDLKWFNPKLNSLQKAAVARALEGKCRPLPFVIIGPPGTGKTCTLVEFILQAYTLTSNSTILVTAPSNSAADNIFQHLIANHAFQPGELVRLIAKAREEVSDIPENILPYCSTGPENDPKKYRGRFKLRLSFENNYAGPQRIIVSTCTAVGLLHNYELKQGHFSHIIVDEVGQALEPEALIPISFLDPVKSLVVISGDPQQLGPFSAGFKSKVHDLSVTFLDRITQSVPYKQNKVLYPTTNGFDPRCTTKLLYNYRSVPEILNLPNTLFYNSELVATVSQETGPEADIIRRLNFECDGRKTPPAIIFHGTQGITRREENSNSYYNMLEARQAASYLKRLYAIGLKPEEVGIITPYRKQVQRIRMIITSMNVEMPKIGSVEEFQGQERLAIILSTVRSQSKSEIRKREDIVNTMGFLCNPRRVNVAITRARALLIIIGNPFTLRSDPYWSSIIKYCLLNKSCTGCQFESSFKDDEE